MHYVSRVPKEQRGEWVFFLFNPHHLSCLAQLNQLSTTESERKRQRLQFDEDNGDFYIWKLIISWLQEPEWRLIMSGLLCTFLISTMSPKYLDGYTALLCTIGKYIIFTLCLEILPVSQDILFYCLWTVTLQHKCNVVWRIVRSCLL